MVSAFGLVMQEFGQPVFIQENENCITVWIPHIWYAQRTLRKIHSLTEYPTCDQRLVRNSLELSRHQKMSSKTSVRLRTET